MQLLMQVWRSSIRMLQVLLRPQLRITIPLLGTLVVMPVGVMLVAMLVGVTEVTVTMEESKAAYQSALMTFYWYIACNGRTW